MEQKAYFFFAVQKTQKSGNKYDSNIDISI